ncbi:siderophore synthetase component [Aminobacter aminovorans]|uniref:Aerobactin synthase IucC n=1 Tax=Aminobacter aminovorans TaxID=83263 RepID=A0A380WFJ8_AMIAI|nr:IucA/IucC family protein [Aminobacter aminovorans]TCS25326.1 siderophore synthetase component [Aminobacter aminovorans]SUU86976.1 Aerobactin synthase IucC [Aminobacter aminovorans]
MPLPLDLPGRPDERVARQLVEAALYEGLFDTLVAGDGTQLTFTWSQGAKRFRCDGAKGAFGRIRLSAGSIESESRDGAWQAATLDELVASLPASVEDKRRLLGELYSTVAHCSWNDRNLQQESRRDLGFAALESALHEGHAYHPCFKARTGFSESDHRDFGPEAGNSFQLAWLLVKRSKVSQRLPADEAAFWIAELGKNVFAQLDRERVNLGLAWDDYGLLPLHPWQWQSLRDTLLSPWFADGTAHFAGIAGDRYTASQSIRTLLNADRPEAANVKLSMNMSNSSSLRTIAPHSVCTAPVISRWLGDIVASDPLFETAYPLVVLDEYAGMIADRDGPLAGQLAAIWRRSVTSVLADGEQAVPFNALMAVEHDGRPFIDAWVRRHGFRNWLGQLLEVAILPVWHLLVGHGIATEAHGQNMVLIHRNGWPGRLVLRDFHDSVEYVPGFLSQPDKVPDFLALDPAYRDALPDQYYWMEDVETLGELVTDALFVFNLAEVSHLLQTFYGLREADFWTAIRRMLTDYAATHGLGARQDQLALWRPTLTAEALLARKLNTGRSSHAVPNPLSTPDT